jgi:hypothetical protein
VLALAIRVLSALVGFAPSAEAQTAHFSWAMTNLGSGFNHPIDVAVDGSGNVFVTHSTNNAVVKLDFADAPSLSFASSAFGSTSSDSPQTVTLTNIGDDQLHRSQPHLW